MVLGGLALMVVGLVLLGRLPVDGGYVVDLLPATVVLGAGFGLAMPALTGLGMSGTTAADSGWRRAPLHHPAGRGGARAGRDGDARRIRTNPGWPRAPARPRR